MLPSRFKSVLSIVKSHSEGLCTITCSSKEVPTAESLAFWYHEFNRESLLVWEIDLVLTYVPIPGYNS